jgi:hypothetical protein
MSILVEFEKLRAEAAPFGSAPYLLSTSDDGRPHAVLVTAAWSGDEIVVKAGARSTANAATRPLVSLLWIPFESGGYSLIVDGEARTTGSGADSRVLVRPTRGVLHRPADQHAPLKEGCGADCVPLLG